MLHDDIDDLDGIVKDPEEPCEFCGDADCFGDCDDDDLDLDDDDDFEEDEEEEEEEDWDDL